MAVETWFITLSVREVERERWPNKLNAVISTGSASFFWAAYVIIATAMEMINAIHCDSSGSLLSVSRPSMRIVYTRNTTQVRVINVIRYSWCLLRQPLYLSLSCGGGGGDGLQRRTWRESSKRMRIFCFLHRFVFFSSSSSSRLGDVMVTHPKFEEFKCRSGLHLMSHRWLMTESHQFRQWYAFE